MLYIFKLGVPYINNSFSLKIYSWVNNSNCSAICLEHSVSRSRRRIRKDPSWPNWWFIWQSSWLGFWRPYSRGWPSTSNHSFTGDPAHRAPPPLQGCNSLIFRSRTTYQARHCAGPDHPVKVHADPDGNFWSRLCWAMRSRSPSYAYFCRSTVRCRLPCLAGRDGWVEQD